MDLVTNDADDGSGHLIFAVSFPTGVGLAWMVGAYAFDTLGETYAIGASFAAVGPCSLIVAAVLTAALHLYRRFSR